MSKDCAGCEKPIEGTITTAMGKSWHPEHFVCTVCKDKFSDGKFVEHEGKPYCPKDYQDQFSPKCAGCNEAIVGKYTTALNQKWHPEHFVCTKCGNPFEGGFSEKDGKPYCREDFEELFSPKCDICSKSMVGKFVTVGEKKFHPDCFVCNGCKDPFGEEGFFEKAGQTYCDKCIKTA